MVPPRRLPVMLDLYTGVASSSNFLHGQDTWMPDAGLTPSANFFHSPQNQNWSRWDPQMAHSRLPAVLDAGLASSVNSFQNPQGAQECIWTDSSPLGIAHVCQTLLQKCLPSSFTGSAAYNTISSFYPPSANENGKHTFFAFATPKILQR